MGSSRGWAVAAVALVLGASVPVRAENLIGQVALLQGLDKVTAQISTIHAPVGETVHFGTLAITVHRCVKHPPEETPESAALMEIDEVREGEAAKVLFKGWMFASSPALNALEHPVYDIWVKDCLKLKSSDESAPR